MKGSFIRWLSQMRWLSPARRLELYPPFWLMRIKVLEWDDAFRHLRILLPLTALTANARGNMFGGVQAALADPIPALACLRLFPGRRVATKRLSLDFIRVGHSSLVLEFDFPPELEARIREELDRHGRADPCFSMVYRRADGEVCTRIENTVAIRPADHVGRLDRKA